MSASARIRELINLNKTAPEQYDGIIKVLRSEGFTLGDASIKQIIATSVRQMGGKRTRQSHKVKSEVKSEVTPKVAKVKNNEIMELLDDVVLNLQLIRGEVARLTEIQNKLRDFIK